jgi:hypothetical protein
MLYGLPPVRLQRWRADRNKIAASQGNTSRLSTFVRPDWPVSFVFILHSKAKTKRDENDAWI